MPRPEHSVSRTSISPNALKVLYRLHEAGFQAFLVGGAVRDLLLGKTPKDFDIATDAHPDDVDALFRNSRLIGRRFRLAHVRFGREVIEVATFRGKATDNESDQAALLDGDGRILRDNVYGQIDEDVWRRDFTANALYYNIADFSIWDYVGGIRDIRARQLRLIGDTEQRLREDPVRMLRAIRFAAKLGFTIDPAVADIMPELAPLLANVPAARLFDEFVKLFQGGAALASFDALEKSGLFAVLFPDTAAMLDSDSDGHFRRFVTAALVNTDQRIASGQSVTPMFLLGVFLWEPSRQLAAKLAAADGLSPAQALSAAAAQTVLRQTQRIAIPRRFSAPMREMYALQPRFARREGRRAASFLEHRRFRAAYDFYLLRAEAGDTDAESAIAEFWTGVQTMPAAQRRREFGTPDGERSSQGRRRRRRPRRRPPSNHGLRCNAPIGVKAGSFRPK
ncbi:MAG: polynucleotide adenylyltransferase PcnB, partial [Pseudomonadota bacterium]